MTHSVSIPLLPFAQADLSGALEAPGLSPLSFAALASALARRTLSPEDQRRSGTAEALACQWDGSMPPGRGLLPLLVDLARLGLDQASPWTWLCGAAFGDGEDGLPRLGGTRPGPSFWGRQPSHWTERAARSALALSAGLLPAARLALLRWVEEDAASFDHPEAAESYTLHQALLLQAELSQLLPQLGAANRQRLSLALDPVSCAQPEWARQEVSPGYSIARTFSGTSPVALLLDADSLSPDQALQLRHRCGRLVGPVSVCVAARNHEWEGDIPAGIRFLLAPPVPDGADHLLLEEAERLLADTTPETALVLATTDTDLIPAAERWRNRGRTVHLLCPRPLPPEHGALRLFRVHGARIHLFPPSSKEC